MNERFRYWLPFLTADVPADLTSPAQVARFELDQAIAQISPDLQVDLQVDPSLGEGFRLHRENSSVTITGGESGVLYGAYRLLMSLYACEKIPHEHAQHPKYALRMVNCWDNADGDIERGYSGRSLFFEGGRFDYDLSVCAALRG